MLDHNDVTYKKELRDLLGRIDSALTSASIKFFAVYGTCLGAVRDGGIIPWDDDIDIAVKREDFKRAIETLNSSQLALFAGDRKTIIGCPSRCGRVFNRVDERSSVERRRAYVDLHVIDSAPVGNFRFYWSVLWYVGVLRITQRRQGKVENGHPLLYLVADLVSFPLRMLPSSMLESFADWLYIYRKKTNRIKITYDGNRKRYLASDFVSTKRLPFDGATIPVPIGAESFLSMCYGDWIVPPPLSERTSHQFDKTGEVWNVPLPNDEDRML